MIIEKLVIHNFRKFKKFEVKFEPGLNVVEGPNESGKTTILDAIAFTIYGAALDELKQKNLVHYGRAVSRVDMTLTNRKKMIISRIIKRTNKGLVQSTEVNNKIVPLLDFQSQMSDLFGEKSWFDAFLEVDQADMYNLLDMPTRIFEETLSKYSTVSSVMRAIDATKVLKIRLNKEKDLHIDQVLAISRNFH